MLRLFDYWYTLDELGNRVRLDLSDPTSNILDDKTTTVNVYAAWQDGTVGSDEEEDVVHEDLVDENPAPPAPAELTAKAVATYKGEGGNTESVDLPVEVENLPSAAHSLSVIHMGYDDVGDFYEKHSNDFGDMAPLLGLKISPKNASGDTVQPAEGQAATVTVSGLDKLPEIAAMEEVGALTANTLKVLHETSDGNVEILDVLTYTNGTLTFETSSFSPFVLVRTDGYDTELLDERKTNKDWYDKAGLYIMYDPEAKPDSNDTTMWTGVVTVYGEHAKLGDLNGATWTEDRNIFFRNIGGADSDTAKQYIKYWPDGAAYNGPRVLEPGNPFRQTDVTYNGKSATLENMIFEMYKGKLVTMYTDNGYSEEQANNIVTQLKASDITFTITPHKISKSNNESINPDKHIDCTVTVNCNRTFTARFNVKKSASGVYTPVYNKLYLWNNEDPNKNTVTTETKDKVTDLGGFTDENGAQWVFDGWYPENAAGTGPGENAATWPHTVTITELDNTNDRVVNFYAHYKKATSNVTITKQVTGLMGDTNKNFTFNVSITQKNGDACTGVTAKKGDQPVSDLTNFTLKHNETVTLENVPIGATITVKESAPGEHYTVSATGHDGEKNGGSDVTFTYVAVANTATASDADEADLMLLSMEDGTAVDTDAVALADATDKKVSNNIMVTNHCALEPDTGVLLDTLPYIVILAVVAGGVALLMLRKRRKEDD